MMSLAISIVLFFLQHPGFSIHLFPTKRLLFVFFVSRYLSLGDCLCKGAVDFFFFSFS